MTPSTPLVSVLLAVRDGERYLRTAIASVLEQSVADLELVVVDDGSVDATPEILAGVEDRRVVVVVNERPAGLASALNRGLDLARGRFVARLDADDVAFPTRLERQLERIRSGPNVGIVGSGVLELGADDRFGRTHLMPVSSEAVAWVALFTSPFFHPTVLLDRELLEQHGLRYDPRFAESEDYELWTRVLALSGGANLPEPLVLYRRHAGQASNRRRGLQRELQREVALRQISQLAPQLAGEECELAWMLGVGEPVAADRLEHAVSTYLTVLERFESRHGAGPGVREAKAAAARVLARAAFRVGRRSGTQLMRNALVLDSALPFDSVTARARRFTRGVQARRSAQGFLARLADTGAGGDGDGAGPARVAIVLPEPTPFRTLLLDRVATRPEVDLTVVYAARTIARRTWTIEPRHKAIFLDGISVPGAYRLLLHDYPLTRGVWRELSKAQPEVVVLSGWSTFAAQATFAWCLTHRIPYLLFVESHDLLRRAGWRRMIRRAVVPPFFHRAAGVLAVGTLSRASVLAYGVDPERIHLFANTVDVESWGQLADTLAARRPELRRRLGLEDDDVVVLSVARLAAEKRPDALLRAVAAAGDPRLVLVLVGDGPERAALERLAPSLGVRLVLPGDLPWDAVVETYVAADVFALLSARETWGVVVNEALACGLPLVLSDRVGAAADLLRDGENGMLVPAGDVGVAAQALRQLVEDRAGRLRAGVKSRELARGWGYGPSIESFVTAVLDIARR